MTIAVLQYILDVIIELCSFIEFLLPVITMGILSFTIRLVLRRYY